MRRPSPSDATHASARAAITTDRALVVLTWGGWLPEATGISGESARGRSLAELIPDLEARGLEQRLRAVAEHEQVLVLSAPLHGYLIPCPPRRPSAFFTHMQQHVVATPIRSATGVVGVTVSIEDVTLRREHFRRLAQQLVIGDEDERLQTLEELAAEETAGPVLRPALRDPSWRVRRAARDAFVSGGPEGNETLLAVLRTEHRDPAALNAAVDALARRGPEVVPPLVDLLTDRSADVRIYAALTLGLAGHREAVPDLLHALGDPDVNVRFHAIEALGRLAPIDVGMTLLRIAEDKDVFLAFPALDAIARIGDGSLADSVVALLAVEDLEEPALAALGGTGGLEHVEHVVRRIRPGGPVRAAVEALSAIHRRFERRGVAPLVRVVAGREQIEALAELIESERPEAAPDAVEILGWIEHPDVDALLARAVEKPELSAAARHALARRARGAIPTLIRLLGAEHEETRIAAAEVLAEVGGADAVPALIGLLDEAEPAAVAAAGALKNIGDERAFEPLLRLLDARDVTLRHAAVGALNSGGLPDLGARTRPLLAHASPRVREAAARVVGYFGESSMLDPLVALLEDPDDDVRAAVAEHLGSFEGAAVPAALARALADPAPAVRSAAARGLAQLDTRAAAPLLALALRDAKLWVRYEGARSAARHVDADLRAVLEEAAADDRALPVRIAALEALGAMGSDRLGALALLALKSDAEEEGDLAFAAVAAVNAARGMEPRSRREVLHAALRSSDPRVRAEAARGLGSLGDADAVSALIDRLDQDDAPVVTGAALRALVATADRRAIEAVLAMLGDRALGHAAREALACAPERAASALAIGLESLDPSVRRDVVMGLQQVPGPAASAALAAALSDDVPAVRIAAQRALQVRDLRCVEEGFLDGADAR